MTAVPGKAMVHDRVALMMRMLTPKVQTRKIGSRDEGGKRQQFPIDKQLYMMSDFKGVHHCSDTFI